MLKKIIILCSLFFSVICWGKNFYKDENFSLSYYTKIKKVKVRVVGLMRDPMAEKIEELVATVDESKEIEFQFNSVGGSIFVAKEIVNIIDRLKSRGHFISTSVAHGEMCASSCVPVYVQGQKRFATNVSTFMFHGVAIYLISNVPDPDMTQFMIDAYQKAGINQSWIDEHIQMGVWSTPNETYYNGSELFANGSAIVTDLLSHRLFFKSYNNDYSSKPKTIIINI